MPARPVLARLRRRLLLGGAGAGVVALLLGALLTPAGATTLRTDLLTETFTGSSTSTQQWALPATGSNVACLTAGTGTTTTTPIKGCALGTSADAAGSGTLRLTGSAGTLAGSVFSTTGVPLAQGLDVTFNSYQWNGSSADGISFVLAATDPDAPSTPSVTGATGEGLGYASAHTAPGVSYGYLGLGLDVYGNFAQTASDTPNGCGQTSSPVRTQEAITVRGPGNAKTGYCVLGRPAPVTGLLDKSSARTRPIPVPVEVAINPTSDSTTTSSGVAVPARSWAVQVTPYANATAGSTVMAAPQTVTGPLPSASSATPASWVDSTGLPYLVTFGWAGSTGGSTETHEIDGFRATSLTGPLPVYSLTTTDDQLGQLAVGGQATVALTPHLDAAQGAEATGVPVTVRAVFPAALAPRSGAFRTNGYSCVTTGATVACTLTPTASIAAGSALPTAEIPVTGASAGQGVVTATVTSRDSNPGASTHALATTTMTARSSDIAYGADEALSASGLSGAATGTVVFTDAAGTVCTAQLPATSCAATRPRAGTHVVTAAWTPTTGPRLTASTSFVVAKAALATTATAPTSTPWGTPAVLGLTGLDATATGTIAFTTTGGSTLCTSTLPATSCTGPAALDVGDHAVDAQYSGDADHQPSSARTTATVLRRTTPITASAAGASTPFGTPVVLTADGLPTSGPLAATGSVEYRTTDGDLLCTAMLPATSCPAASTLPVGDHTVTAQYGGDAHGLPAQSAPVTFSVARAPVTATAGAPAAPVAHGTRVPLTATGVPAAGTGSVTFTDQAGRVLCSFDVTRASSCSTRGDLAAGTISVIATYSGDGSFQPAAAAPVALRVAQGVTPAFVASVATAQVPFGTADVLVFTGLPADATGSVRFEDAAGVVCTVPDVTAADTCRTARDLPVGDRSVTATYSGDVSYPTATATTAFQVTRAASALTASTATARPVFGVGARLVAGGLPSGATGTVRFLDEDGSLLCAADLTTDASCAAPTAAATGTHRVAARYSGDEHYLPSTDTTAFTVTPAATTVTGAVAAGATAAAGPVLAITGLDVRGADAATGTVVFRMQDGTVLCTATLPDTTCTPTVALAAGRFVVRAEYSGDRNHRASVDVLDLTVPKAAIALSLRARLRAIEPGMRLRLTVGGVTGVHGTVRVLADGAEVCTIAAPVDSCEVRDSHWPLGRMRLTARYSGDDGHLPADAATSVLVRQPDRLAQQATATTAGDGRLTASSRTALAGDARIVRKPAHGSVALVDGAWRYTAESAAMQADSFSYRVVRKDGSSVLVTVTVRAGRLAETGSAVVGPIGVGAGLIGAGLLLLGALLVLRRKRARG